MIERERPRDPEETPPGPPVPPVHNPLHQAGEELLAAADEALRRVLSGDSEAFLRENKQEGGE